jgi:hypothetical protein
VNYRSIHNGRNSTTTLSHHEAHEEHEGKKYYLKIRWLCRAGSAFFVAFVTFVVNGQTSVMREKTECRRRLPWASQRFVPVALASAILLTVLFSACGRDLKTAQGIAEEFVDQHYVHIDLRKAKEFAVSVALYKINEEIRLTAGQVIDASTRKPSVHYRLVEKKKGSGRVSFLYEGTIRAEDAPDFTRRWLVVTRKEDDQWRVSNFTESD